MNKKQFIYGCMIILLVCSSCTHSSSITNYGYHEIEFSPSKYYTGSLEGYVLDEQDNKIIPGVISISGVILNEKKTGYFKDAIRPGFYKINCSSIGYEDYQIRQFEIPPSTKVTIRFYLKQETD